MVVVCFAVQSKEVFSSSHGHARDLCDITSSAEQSDSERAAAEALEHDHHARGNAPTLILRWSRLDFAAKMSLGRPKTRALLASA